MYKLLVPMLGALATAWPAIAQVHSGEEAWGPPPPGLPPGSQAAVLYGDPGKPGLFVIRAKLPAGYTVPPHWHSTDESLTVISGDLTLGMGDRLDPAIAAKLTTGGFIVTKANMRHFARTEGGAVLQIAAQGPFSITYVNPADDPRR